MRGLVVCDLYNTSKGDGSAAERETKFEPNLKYSETDEQDLISWIQLMTGSNPQETGPQGFYEWLKDGQVLSKLMDRINPGAYTVNPPSKSRLPAKRAMLERENINFFIQAAKSYGVPIQDLFQIPYLYDQENLYQVQLTLIILKGLYEAKGSN